MLSGYPRLTEIDHDRSVVIAAGKSIRYSDMYKQYADSPVKDIIGKPAVDIYRKIYR